MEGAIPGIFLDGLNTTGTLDTICQNSKFDLVPAIYSLGLVTGDYLDYEYEEDENMYMRFHNIWEFWAYNIAFDIFQAPYYAFSQTMMAEPGSDNISSSSTRRGVVPVLLCVVYGYFGDLVWR
ncbi:uncharacterized protein HD556DRAFT_1314162 [Suillus plorans]|uniref:Uncharacterized protein n=1 Tax=Suillus plorans TaxID=116603 RepID=A0A9P7DAI5_9AGAM|nr:uncharacterized protein HD556DRAFT_1314162 [Suillus plorans]KAG1785534.1 hypothetical protein HD556DRAFT_1314162 [Suillus plorans]